MKKIMAHRDINNGAALRPGTRFARDRAPSSPERYALASSPRATSFRAASRAARRRAAGLASIAALCLASSACGDSREPGATEAGTSSGDDVSAGGSTATSSGDVGGSSTGGASDGATSSTGADVCPEGPVEVVQGFLATPGETGLVPLGPCEARHRWYFAAPAGSVLELALTGHEGVAVEAVVGFPDTPALEPVVDGDTLAGPIASAGGDVATLQLVASRSGEFAVQLAAAEDGAGAQYELALACVRGCALETTRFPIVLAHGWTGFANIGPVDYFYGVPDHLGARGYPVSVTEVDKYNTSYARAEQLAAQLDALLPSWRARKVNLIGHSQGGVDARALISARGYGDRVSALITVGTPHRGSYAVDVALGYAPGPSQEVLFLLFDFLGAVTADEQADVEASLHGLSEAYMTNEFNPHNPDDPRVEYISYTGRSCAPDEFLNPQNDCEDLVDPIWALTYGILRAAQGDNDGLVTVESAKWGEFRGLMFADHLDEVGQLLGATDPAFDHLEFYLARARELAEGSH